jgi:hypothetical protein
MSQEQEQYSPDAGKSEGGSPQAQQQQQQQPQSHGNGGQGSDSAMKHLRVWEQQRAGVTGRKHRPGGS